MMDKIIKEIWHIFDLLQTEDFNYAKDRLNELGCRLEGEQLKVRDEMKGGIKE